MQYVLVLTTKHTCHYCLLTPLVCLNTHLIVTFVTILNSILFSTKTDTGLECCWCNCSLDVLYFWVSFSDTVYTGKYQLPHFTVKSETALVEKASSALCLAPELNGMLTEKLDLSWK